MVGGEWRVAECGVVWDAPIVVLECLVQVEWACKCGTVDKSLVVEKGYGGVVAAG